jgi:hypothetical protein
VCLPSASHISRNMADVSVSAGRLTAGAAAIHTRGVVLGAIPLDGSSDDVMRPKSSIRPGSRHQHPLGWNELLIFLQSALIPLPEPWDALRMMRNDTVISGIQLRSSSSAVLR